MVKTSQTFLDEIRDDVEEPERSINEDNYEDYLVDEVEDRPIPREEYPSDNEFISEIPTGNELLGIPADTPEKIYQNPLDLVYDGIDKNEVISFHYTNRNGDYSGLRTVEPHYTFVAYTTGNEVLVSYDRDVNDIRAFIISNIHPDGVRYKGVKFEDRPEIMVGIV